MKILVADDSKINLVIITEALNRLGHHVIAANSGEQAIVFFQHDSPDLVILDVVMEGMDGFECARRIRAINTEDWIPIVFLSASVDDESIAKGIDSGGDDYLTKPFSEITLAAKIKAMQRISDMRKKLFDATQQLYLLSSTDSLTGIYNRFQFDRSIKEILSAADRFKHKVALFFIDLDTFKSINDTFGHHMGDLLLKEVAARLKACLRINDFIARLGGDEFAIILSEIQYPDEAIQIAEKIIDTLSKNYFLDNHNIRNGASIGISCYPFPSTNKDELIINADMAMYHAKATGRNNFKLYNEELNAKYKQQISLEHALKFSLEKKELHLTYQPIYNLNTNQLTGVEAQLYWDHPTFGIVLPNVFLPIAEEIGLISSIGDWMLRTSCQQTAEWLLRAFKTIKLSINVSSRQLLKDNFVENINHILSEFKIMPSQLELEITENMIMTQTNDLLISNINKLHQAGIGIAIDHFGTGYSSLMRLQHLPIDTLKIEKMFVQDAVNNQNSAIIVSCLVALGKKLGMKVIADGIETQKQLDFLVQKDCTEGQGKYLAAPLEIALLKDMLESSQVVSSE